MCSKERAEDAKGAQGRMVFLLVLHAVGRRNETATNPAQPQTTNVNRYFMAGKVPTNMSHVLLKINEAT